jgi:hypothetical protein
MDIEMVREIYGDGGRRRLLNEGGDKEKKQCKVKLNIVTPGASMALRHSAMRTPLFFKLCFVDFVFLFGSHCIGPERFGAPL